MNDNTKYIVVGVDPKLWTALIELCTREGSKPIHVIARLLEKAIEERLKFFKLDGQELSTDQKIFLMYMQAVTHTNRLHQLTQIAAFALERDDTTMVDNLSILCEEAGISIDEVTDNARNLTQTFGSITNVIDPNSKEAIRQWIEAVMIANNFRILSDDVEKMYASKKWSKPKVDVVKRKMGIDSIRIGNAWYWDWSEHNRPLNVTEELGSKGI